MQKNKNNASILIWSIFLSLILSITFINISYKINQNLKKNKSYIDQNKGNNLIKNKLNNKDYTNEKFNLNNENIVFNQILNYSGSLKKDESIKIKLVENSDISINIISGGPIFYENYTNGGILTLSGIINSNTLLTISGSISLNNLGSYTIFNIDSNNNLLPPEINYKIIKTIGNKNIIKTRGIINN